MVGGVTPLAWHDGLIKLYLLLVGLIHYLTASSVPFGEQEKFFLILIISVSYES
jgi:hypothetical protein